MWIEIYKYKVCLWEKLDFKKERIGKVQRRFVIICFWLYVLIFYLDSMKFEFFVVKRKILFLDVIMQNKNKKIRVGFSKRKCGLQEEKIM